MPEAASTFRVEEELKAAFSEAAKSQDQTGAQLLRSFIVTTSSVSRTMRITNPGFLKRFERAWIPPMPANWFLMRMSKMNFPRAAKPRVGNWHDKPL